MIRPVPPRAQIRLTSRLLASGLLAGGLLVGCAPKTAPVPSAEPPAWTTEDGVQSTRIALVEALLDSEQPEAALHVIREMRTAGVDIAELSVLQAEALRAIGLYEDAEALLLADLADRRRARSAPESHNQLGILYMDQGRTESAVAHFRLAHQQAPSSPEYANNLGFALMVTGSPDEAIAVLRAALQQDATRVRTRNNLGFALIADERPDEAYRIFRSSSSEDEAQYNLGVGLELSGALRAAADAYTAALEANPQHRRAQEALQRLRASPSPEEPAP